MVSDDIVTRLRELGRYVNTEGGRWFEPITTEAADEIERLRKLISDYVSLWGQVETGHFPHGVYDPENVVNAYYAKFHEMKQAVRGE